jgi:3-hydroxyisobutyrate dehydrogenase
MPTMTDTRCCSRLTSHPSTKRQRATLNSAARSRPSAGRVLPLSADPGQDSSVDPTGRAAYDSTARVGFIGLGSQGAGIARRLLDHGLPTTLWARRKVSLEPFRDSAARFAASPQELGACSDILGVCVVDDAGVEQVLLGAHGALDAMTAGSVVAIHSTISLATLRRIAEIAAARGVAVIDAPVSGGGQAAERGELTVLVGGASGPFANAQRVLKTLGRVIHLGPLGSGLTAKLVNNTLHAAHYALAREAIDAAVNLGLERSAVSQALSICSGSSYSLKAAVQAGGIDALAPAVGPLLRKDVGIFAALASAHGVSAATVIAAADAALRDFGVPRRS